MHPAPSDIPLEIDVHEVHRIQQEKADFLFVDCREHGERELVRIAGTHWIPMGEIVARCEEFEPYRNGRIVVHCHHGGRSLQVTQWLRQQGFPGAQNMAGGIDAWAVEIDPRLPRY